MQKVLSIEIGITTTKICEMDYKKKNPKIYRSIIFNTPENTIEDGYIRDKSAFAEVMKKKLDENGVRIKNVVFTISSNKILSREVVIPLVKENRIAAVIESEANEYFPRDITDHIVTYTILEKRMEEKKMLLLAFAAPANLVKNYYSFAELLGLSVIAIDYVGNSSYQWLKKTASTECDFVLQINEENSIVTIMNDGVLTLQRTINYGTNMLAEAVIETNAFAVEEMAAAAELLQREELLWPRFMMDMEEDKLVKLDKFDKNVEASLLHMHQAKEIVTDSMQLFISNLSRIIEYQVTRSHQMNQPLNIKEILITGGGAQVRGIDVLIGNELAIPVKKKEDFTNVTLVGTVQVEQHRLPEFITCFGASIAPVNFVPQDYVATEQKRDFWKLYAGLLGATVLVSGLLYFFGYQNYSNATKEKERLESEINRMSYIEAKYNEYVVLQEAHTSFKTFDLSTYNSNEKINQVLAELEKNLPTSSMIHSINSTSTEITMSITTVSKEVAGQLLLQLQLIPYITEVHISGLTETKDEATNITSVDFTVSCEYKQPENSVTN